MGFLAEVTPISSQKKPPGKNPGRLFYSGEKENLCLLLKESLPADPC
jgi:hypothetical protein